MHEQNNPQVPQQNTTCPTAAPQRSGALACEESQLETSLWEAPLPGTMVFLAEHPSKILHTDSRSKLAVPKKSP